MTVTVTNEINWKTYKRWKIFRNNSLKSTATNDQENYLELFPGGVMKDNSHFVKYKHISKPNSHQLYNDHRYCTVISFLEFIIHFGIAILYSTVKSLIFLKKSYYGFLEYKPNCFIWQKPINCNKYLHLGFYFSGLVN